MKSTVVDESLSSNKTNVLFQRILQDFKMNITVEKCLGMITIHNGVAVYGKGDKGYHAKLLNLMNIAANNGLVWNARSWDLELHSMAAIVQLRYQPKYHQDNVNLGYASSWCC